MFGNAETTQPYLGYKIHTNCNEKYLWMFHYQRNFKFCKSSVQRANCNFLNFTAVFVTIYIHDNEQILLNIYLKHGFLMYFCKIHHVIDDMASKNYNIRHENHIYMCSVNNLYQYSRIN